MKKLLALILVTLAFVSCGGPSDDKSSDLIDGILENSGDSDAEVVEEYVVLSSNGPTSLPPEEE